MGTDLSRLVAHPRVASVVQASNGLYVATLREGWTLHFGEDFRTVADMSAAVVLDKVRAVFHLQRQSAA